MNKIGIELTIGHPHGCVYIADRVQCYSWKNNGKEGTTTLIHLCPLMDTIIVILVHSVTDALVDSCYIYIAQPVHDNIIAGVAAVG